MTGSNYMNQPLENNKLRLFFQFLKSTHGVFMQRFENFSNLIIFYFFIQDQVCSSL